MLLKLPRNLTVDTENVPDNFEEIIEDCFRAYTNGTRKEYRYQDKLCFIDICRKFFHKAESTPVSVRALMEDLFKYRLDELGEFTCESDFLSIEFMEDCFEKGRTNLYSHDYDKEYAVWDSQFCDKVMKILERIIKVVINYED